MVNEIQKSQYSKPFGVFMPDTPDFGKLAEAYGVATRRIKEDEDMAGAISEMLTHKGPYVLELVVSADERTTNNVDVIKEQFVCPGD